MIYTNKHHVNHPLKVVEKSIIKNPYYLAKESHFRTLSIGKNDIVFLGDSSIFKWDIKYQEAVENKINNLLKSKNYTIESPLLIYNPFGTNTCSVNAYFNTDQSAKVKPPDSFIPDYRPRGKQRKYPNFKGAGQKQEISWNKNFYNKNGKFKIQGCTKISAESGQSEGNLSDGLYTMLCHDGYMNPYIFMIDN